MKKGLIFLGLCGFLVAGCNKGDDTAPEINITGGDISQLLPDTAGTASWNDPGVSAIDDEDGTVSVTSTGSVDPNKKGIYYITYSATDKAGNTAIKVRTVNITNGADFLAGLYLSCYDSCDITPKQFYDAKVVTSETVNNEFQIINFGGFGVSVKVTARLRGQEIIIPSPQTISGSAVIEKSFPAPDSQVTDMTQPTFQVKYVYNDGTGGDKETCIGKYRR